MTFDTAPINLMPYDTRFVHINQRNLRLMRERCKSLETKPSQGFDHHFVDIV